MDDKTIVGVENLQPLQFQRKNIRLKNYDYSQNGLYFITICTQNKEYVFGKIEDGKMLLNDAGKYASNCWVEITEHFPNVFLHEYVIMPNHVHGIIEIVGVENLQPLPFRRMNDKTTVGVENFQPMQPKKNAFQKMIPRSIGSIVRGYKIGVTKKLGCSKWQRNYYEHIIRNEEEYEKIAEYIENNPANWDNDEEKNL
jgi:REP element-mobilizing transposase RayT